MTTTRKLAAILFADVVGYSRLMGEDEAGTARAVREHREAARTIVESHGGRIVRTIGDGLFVEFPSVVAAVECAITIQKRMAESNAETAEAKHILYRIGVNLGDMLIEGDDIIGDGVNIAARLESICEPGGVFISGAAFDHVRGRVDAQFTDLGERDLKNIARPVRVYAVKAPAKGAASAASASAFNQPGPPRLSIVVLPFANLSGDPEQEYFVDGVTDSLTTDLSRISGSFVIGRSTAFTYKRRHVNLKQVGRELNVRYVLEGSILRAGSRMRVNVQLIDAESGAHLWAERFDKSVVDLFDMHDEIVARLANALYAQFFEAEARRAQQSPNPDAMDLCMQARALYYKGFAPENLAQAQRLYERALALDPAILWGLVGVAVVDLIVALNFFPDDQAARFAAAEAALDKALSVAPDYAITHACMGTLLVHTNRISLGVRECERALELDRNLAAAHAQLGSAKVMLGQAEDTEAHILEALRLSPHDSIAHIWCTFAGVAKLFLGKDEEAVGWLLRSLDANRTYPSARFALAVALAHLGRLAEARAEAQAGLAMLPTFTISRFRASALGDSQAMAAGRERYIDGLRMAGVPEG